MQAFSYEENKIKWHDVGHMTKVVAMPIYVMIDLDIFDVKVEFQS